MSNDALRRQYQAVDWGIGNAARITRRARRAPGRPSARTLQWMADLEAVLGTAPRGRRALLSWPDLQPDGPGTWHRAALDRSVRAVDSLLDDGFHPVVTLLRHGLPDWLDSDGGWLSRTAALRFADYAAELGRRLGDRPIRWVTSADFATSTVGDHVAGMTSPGRGAGVAGLAAVHHMLLGHGLAIRALRAGGVRTEIGGTVILYGGYPATDDSDDRLAVQRAESLANRLFLDPLLRTRHLVVDGHCPVEATGCVRDGDLDVIATPQDAVYLSWHAPLRVTTAEKLPLLMPATERFQALNDLNRLLAGLGFAVVPFNDVETADHGWPVLPEALADALAGLATEYGRDLPPVRIVDNGMSDAGGRSPRHRQTVLAARLRWLAAAMDRGVSVRGYEYWSVLDQIDWVAKYAKLYPIAESNRNTKFTALEWDWTRAGSFAPIAADPQAQRSLRLV